MVVLVFQTETLTFVFVSKETLTEIVQLVN